MKKNMKIKAVFTGRNGSMDYEKDKEYKLIITHGMCLNITIRPIGGGHQVEYGSMVSFLNNWDNIRNI